MKLDFTREGATAVQIGNHLYTPAKPDFDATVDANNQRDLKVEMPKEPSKLGVLYAASGRAFTKHAPIHILDWALVDCNTSFANSGKPKTNAYP